MARLKDILDEMRDVVEHIPTSHDSSKTFVRHKTNQPFELSPSPGAHSFEVTFEDFTQTGAFGLQGTEERVAVVLLKIGHPPFAKEEDRNDNVASDVERLANIIEYRGWDLPGVEAVFFTSYQTDKADSGWWVTSLRFRIVYTGAIEVN